VPISHRLEQQLGYLNLTAPHRQQQLPVCHRAQWAETLPLLAFPLTPLLLFQKTPAATTTTKSNRRSFIATNRGKMQIPPA
jgi:hypothetical protein